MTPDDLDLTCSECIRWVEELKKANEEGYGVAFDDGGGEFRLGSENIELIVTRVF